VDISKVVPPHSSIILRTLKVRERIKQASILEQASSDIDALILHYARHNSYLLSETDEPWSRFPQNIWGDVHLHAAPRERIKPL
jgi:hypothetical protein